MKKKQPQQARTPKRLFCGFSVVFGMFAVGSLFLIAAGERVAAADKVAAAVGFATTCAILSGSFLIAFAILELAVRLDKKDDSGGEG